MAGQAPQLERFVQQVEQAEPVDVVADKLAAAVRSVLHGNGDLRSLLSGTPVGHPVHPPLTDVTLGALASASLLDLVPTAWARRSASTLTAVGIAAALPTILTGLNDWADTTGAARRVGLAHADMNAIALVLYVLAWRNRGKGRGIRAAAQSWFGYATLLLSGYLGGHLSFRKGVGVDNNAFVTLPQGWHRVAALDELPDQELQRAEVEGVPLALLRTGDRVYAVADRCSHLGGPLAQGHVHTHDTPTVACPWHHSTFRLDDGKVTRGPATAPQPSFETRVEHGVVQVRPR